MKKILLGMMLLASTFISCSKDSVAPDDAGGATIDGENMAQPILLSVASNAIEVTRSTGTVGGEDGKGNEWNGQLLSIYAVKKGDIPSLKSGEGWPFYDQQTGMIGRIGIPEKGHDGNFALTWKDERGNLYYPRSGEFDFWGYYIDDASPSGIKEQYNTAKKYYSVPFKIDGSQDLLRGRAEMNGENAKYAYSAQAAREGIHPKLFFSHLLTRLTFKVKRDPGILNDKGAAEVYIRRIRVKSHNEGELVFIYSDDSEYKDDKEAIVWKNSVKSLNLKERAASGKMVLLNSESVTYLGHEDPNGEPNGYYGLYNPYSPTNRGKYDTKAKLKAAVEQDGLTLEKVLGYYNSSDGKAVTVGEALLVSPAEKYDIEVDVAQYYDSDAEQTLIPESNHIYTYKRTIKAEEIKNLTEFKPSSSYNVTITVHALQSIEAKVELKPWATGGDIIVDTDK